jgi:D-3-phosphoglycerate dehydrogenase / 2-oxoglutarate reductase
MSTAPQNRCVAIAAQPFAQHDPAPREVLESTGAELRDNPHGRKLKRDEVPELLAGCSAVVASTEPYDAGVLDALPELRLIARTGVGMDSVDLDAARARGVAVAWTPEAPSDSVAELVVGFLVSLARHVPRADRDLRAQRWERRTGWLLRQRTVGIIGLGRIGSRVARLLRPFGCRLLATDIDPALVKVATALGVQMVDLETLLAESDAVTTHVPLTPDTHGLIDAAALGRMRPGSLLINTARGEVVDEAALLAALEEGRLGGAALDVFCEEPYRGPLAGRDDVFLTCHMGSCSDQGRLDMELGAARAVAAFLEGAPIPGRLV